VQGLVSSIALNADGGYLFWLHEPMKTVTAQQQTVTLFQMNSRHRWHPNGTNAGHASRVVRATTYWRFLTHLPVSLIASQLFDFPIILGWAKQQHTGITNMGNVSSPIWR
jgi:hypothetical protein